MQYTVNDNETPDFSDLDFDELQELALLLQATDSALRSEIARRSAIENIPAQVEQLVGEYLNATGREPGAEWVAPVGAHDSYPEGWEVTHNGKLWRSLIAGNVFEPGDPGDPQSYRWWRDISTIPEDGEWDGNGRAYAVGDRVTFEGASYECRQGHTSQPGWTPAAVPALWAVV